MLRDKWFRVALLAAMLCLPSMCASVPGLIATGGVAAEPGTRTHFGTATGTTSELTVGRISETTSDVSAGGVSETTSDVSTGGVSETTSDATTEVTIGVLTDGPWFRGDEILGLFKQEISDLLRGEYVVNFPHEKHIVANWTLAGIRDGLERLLADGKVDMVLALGPLASNIAASEGPLRKPVIAPFVIEAMQPPPGHGGGSGVHNLVYLAIPACFERDIRLFQEIVSFKRLVILMTGAFVQAYPNKATSYSLVVQNVGVEQLTVVPVFDSADEVLAQIPEGTEAVYLTGLMTLSDEEFRRLAQGLMDRKLPSFSLLGYMDVRRGILAGVATEALFDRRARRTALTVQRILLGEAPASIPVVIATDQRLSINMATARAIDVSPRWDILNEAELVNELRLDIERRVDLASVMREAVLVNPDLEAQRAALAAGKEEINKARANLLPQIAASATAAFIDKDRAEASFGQAAERTYSGSVGVSQLLFGEQVLANLSIQRHLDRGREQELETLRLDIAQSAALAFLNVLSALTSERIQKENLRTTRKNLELAKVRALVGTAGPAEVYRWEAEIAQSRLAVIEANATRNLAEIQLNRILNRPLEEPFIPADVNLEDPAVILNTAPLFAYVGDRKNFKLLRELLSQEACSIAPELRRLDAAITAQRRYLKSQGWQYFAPVVALEGRVESIFDREGAGSEGSGLGAFLPPEAQPEPADDLNWQVGINVSLPLFSGGSRFANHQQARSELKRLQAQRASAAGKIEQRMRSALHTAGASFAAIRLTREAADAAARTLDVITDAYSRGAVSILELLDAQNAALTTQEAAAIATYQFIGDYVQVQRAIGQFAVFTSDEEQRARIERVETYMITHEGQLPER